MELVKKDCYICFECKEYADRVNFTQHKFRQLELCQKCLIKALMLIMPIDFDLEFIKLFFENFPVGDHESNIGNFIKWIKPFLKDDNNEKSTHVL